MLPSIWLVARRRWAGKGGRGIHRDLPEVRSGAAENFVTAVGIPMFSVRVEVSDVAVAPRLV